MLIPQQIVGLVGPNGCGKSNIIDAVRWVMGESAAGHLRGTSMEDVIFNGSSKRKPVNQAMVELTFDNSEGRAGGAWSSYRELAVRRTVERGGGSTYYINGTKCRRRDVMDIFLGTGLGPRSYAIIEQGMISRVIDAKPEELRTFIEEAAGVSRYKERRRETENRMRHTEDNLARLNDLKQEVEKQTERAARQAKAAERFRALRQDERAWRQIYYALSYRDIAEQQQSLRQAIEVAETNIVGVNTELRRHESSLITQKSEDMAQQQQLEQVQHIFYEAKSQVEKLEQKVELIQNAQRRADQEAENLAQEHERLMEQKSELEASSETRENEAAEALEALEMLEAQMEDMLSSQLEAQSVYSAAELELNEHQQQQARHESEQSLINLKLQQTRREIEQIQLQQQRLVEEQTALLQTIDGAAEQVDAAEIEMLESAVASIAEQLEAQEAQVANAREATAQSRQQLAQTTGELNTQQGKLDALQSLQQKELSAEDAKKQYQLPQTFANAPHLTETISAASGWERAVETTLADWLTARVVGRYPDEQDVEYFLESDLGVVVDARSSDEEIIKKTRLSDKLRQAPMAVLAYCQHIFTAETLAEALDMLGALESHESVVTSSGQWLSPMGLRPNHQSISLEQSLIYRQRVIAELEQQILDLHAAVKSQHEIHTEHQERQSQLEQDIDALKRQNTEQQSALSKAMAEHAARTQQLNEREIRLNTLKTSLAEISTQQIALDDQVKTLTEQLETQQENMVAMADALPNLQQAKIDADVALTELNRQLQQFQQQQQQLQIKQTKLDTEQQAQQARLDDIASRLAQIERAQEQALAIDQKVEIETLQVSIQEALSVQTDASEKLEQAREAAKARQTSLTETEKVLTTQRERVHDAEQAKQQLQIQQAEKQQQSQYQLDRLQELGVTSAAALELMREKAPEATLEQALDEAETLKDKIEKMGSVNLQAIEEHQTLSERLDYLNAQHDDLSEALSTLREAIAEIDEETKSRFEITFNAVNEQVQTLFPKLFGGGKARLELTEDDMLTAGIRIVARPPGKMPASIQLLSGGEKALTAAALVFGIFQLNPSPFCMLDEVDAPLDDANVGRFCALVKSLSDKVQFIIVTHNKVTMEIADQLSGVTMGELGVSRLVSVDIDDAVAMVEA